jgi:hypothetical protein
MAVYFWPILTVGAPVGGATEANQLLQITEETLTNTKLTSVTGTDGAAAPANAFVMGGVTSGGTFQTFETNASGHLNISDGGGSITVDGPLTDTQLRAAPLSVSGAVTTGGLTNAELRASAVPVSLTSTTVTGSVAVTGPLTDVQLRATPVPISGTVSTGGLTDAQLRATAVPVSLTSTTVTGSVAVTGPLTDAQLRATAVPAQLEKAATATLSNVASSATNVTLLASNSARKGAAIYNDSTQNLYLKLGATASTSSFTVLLVAGAYYELPTTSVYTGIIDGIWASANGSARVTELS